MSEERRHKERSHHRHRDDDRHRHKKRRREDEDNEERRKHRPERQKDESTAIQEKDLADFFDEDMWEEKPSEPQKTVASKETTSAPKVERQSWMTEDKNNNDKTDPFSSLLGGTVKEKKPIEQPKPQGLVLSSRELNTSLLSPASGPTDPPPSTEETKYVPPSYIIGDDGSSWRMMKLKNLYKQATEIMRPVEDIAIERLGSLQAFDEAREEQEELERRKRDYRREGVKKVKITGELWHARLEREEQKRRKESDRKRKEEELYPPQKPSKVTASTTLASDTTTSADNGGGLITQSDLNKLQAVLLRAEMISSPEVPKLQKQYDDLVEKFNTQSSAPEIIVLPTSHSTLMPHLSREASKSENEMTIEDMVREERSTKRLQTIDRIARDRKFKDDLDYMDENAEKLAQTVKRKEVDLKNMSVNEYKKQQRIMEQCPLCYKDDGKPPLAPVVSLATRVYLSLPTEPELTRDGAMIVPLRHARNLADCDDDEWEEIRNFMKCLIQFYKSQGREVIFYEDASHPSLHRHPALIAVPMSIHQFSQAPAYFTASLNIAESEWATHRPIIHTSTPELGKWGFRKRIAKEAPYFHVWFDLEGGMGHVVEDQEKWGNGELWVRSILGGGLLDVERSTWGKLGRWAGFDRRTEGFRRKWEPFDWTKALAEEG